ncbi:MAG: chemotaxis protein CheW [Gammaproteobacteria bacterium]|nr:chemotaxis protein CheW [Gammaproteobacteria bacterium]
MSSLTAFQHLQNLSKKTKIKKKIATISDTRKTFLSVGIHKKQVYIDTCDISEVMNYCKVSLVGHTASWFKGLVKVQGEVYSLVDIAPFLKQPPVSDKSGYVVALSHSYNNIAIVADNLFGLQSVDEMRDKKEDEYLDIYQTEKGEICVLALKRLVLSDKFFDVSVFSN